MRDVQIGADHDGRRYWSEINGMLTRRKVSATLQEIVEGRPPVVRVTFPGVMDAPRMLPAVRDFVQVQGILDRIARRVPGQE